MAKAKATSPSKTTPGRKQGSPSPAVPLRRSPRKAVKSAKKAATEALAAPAKVFKRKAVKKSTTSAKKPARSPVRSSAKKTSAATPRKPGATKAAGTTPASNGSRPRGRPKKVGKLASSPLKDAMVVVPAGEREWTDSPKKKSPGKKHVAEAPRRLRSSSASPGGDRPDLMIDKTRLFSVGGVRTTIEAEGSTGVARSKSPGRRAVGGVRGRTRSPAKSMATKPARERRSQSGGAGARAASSERQSRAPSKSPNRQCSQSASRSSLRENSGSPGADAPLYVAKTRGLQSPSKNAARSRQASPSKALPGPATSRQPSGSSSRQHAANSSKALLKAFNDQNDRLGIELRNIEAQAYNAKMSGRAGIVPASADKLNAAEHDFATQRGVQRATEQLALNNAASNGPGGRRARNASPSKGQVDGDTSTRNPRRSNASPSRARSTAMDDARPLPLDQPSAAGRGTCRSATNPEFIPGTDRKNPFFETMPAVEVWHKRMPPVLPFGDTPSVEKAMSKQINDDLAKAREEPAKSSGVWSTVKSTFKAVLGKSAAEIEYPDPWKLPDVPKAEVDRVYRELYEGLFYPNTSKRKASETGPGRAVKRARRGSGEYRMSGALQ